MPSSQIEIIVGALKERGAEREREREKKKGGGTTLSVPLSIKLLCLIGFS